ncbi:helix-turn-helix domain-containing protein [Streptomyces sp. NPDC059534]|uniref:helix-turn-helix domain-containing protein n=1 Tax=Streptomyces sp. NPDC059534 TaxID=3346859 RepID=UPI0036940937
MHDEQNTDNPALAELRRRLEAGRTRLRLDKKALAGLAGLGRTTVSEAFQADGPVPSERTVRELARVLRLPVEELGTLQQAAGRAPVDRSGLGRLIGEWEPHELREEAGDRESAEALARQVAAYGNAGVLYRLAQVREEAGDRAKAETLAQHAAEHGDPSVFGRLALHREEAGDQESAETLARQAAYHGDPAALHHLALRRRNAGDRDNAETLARWAADHGETTNVRLAQVEGVLKGLWPHGLDPDGTPTPPWQPSVSALLDRLVPPHGS